MAGELYRKTLDAQRRVLGDDHPQTLTSMNGLGVSRTKKKQYVEAESLFDQALKGGKHKLSDDHPDALETKIMFFAVAIPPLSKARYGSLITANT
jgi:hypothetical protein